MTSAPSPSIRFITEGDDQVGFGHLMRTLVLAKAFSNAGYETAIQPRNDEAMRFLYEKEMIGRERISLIGAHGPSEWVVWDVRDPVAADEFGVALSHSRFSLMVDERGAGFQFAVRPIHLIGPSLGLPMKQLPVFIAEVSSNHHRDLGRCKRFIDVAAEIGCDAAKFQLFKIRELFAPEILVKSESHRKRKQWELPVDYLPDLAAHCRERKILFSCTPFYLDAVEELGPYVDFYKIASYELLWDDLIAACAATGKPLVLSTGMATMDEIQRAVAVFRGAIPAVLPPSTLSLEPLTLLHCVSGYPTPLGECNLAAIETIRNAFPQVSIGWSDHSVRPEVLERSVCRWGAEVIEFHLDLEGRGEEYSAGHCWLPDEIAPVIRTLKSRSALSPAPSSGESMDGTGRKEPVPSELPDRAWRADPADGLRPLMAERTKWADRAK